MDFNDVTYPCIYKSVNTFNGKVYIGKSINFSKRYKKHKYAKYYNTYFHNAIRKYGFSAFDFSILEVCSKEQMIERESHWIRHFRSNEKEFGYNLRIDSKENSGWTHSKEARIKIGITGLGRIPWNKGKKVKFNKTEKGLASFKEKMSGGKNPKAKKVYQFDMNGKFIKSYPCASDAARELNCFASNICAASYNKVKGYAKNGNLIRVKSAAKFKWSYLAPCNGNIVSAPGELLESPEDAITTTQP